MAAFDLTGIVDKLISFLPADTQAKAKSSRKAIVAGLGSLLTVLTLVSDRFGFIVPQQYKKPIGTAISIITTILTYLTPNDPAPVVDTSGA
jgi:hypothetical protein